MEWDDGQISKCEPRSFGSISGWGPYVSLLLYSTHVHKTCIVAEREEELLQTYQLSCFGLNFVFLYLLPGDLLDPAGHLLLHGDKLLLTRMLIVIV